MQNNRKESLELQFNCFPAMLFECPADICPISDSSCLLRPCDSLSLQKTILSACRLGLEIGKPLYRIAVSCEPEQIKSELKHLKIKENSRAMV